METITIDKDITAMYVTATSFPEGVMAAHQKLHSMISSSKERRYLGMSRPENGGGIVYHAAAEEAEPGEAEKLGLPTIVLKKGQYASTTVGNYMKDTRAIGDAFNQLIARPDIDTQGYCVEWYVSDKDVQCMVRLAQ